MKTRRGRSPRIAALIAMVFVALGLSGLAVADATQLTVTSNRLFLQDASRCTNATIATTGFRSGGGGTTWNRVRLVGVPTACAGLPIALTVYRTSFWGTTTTLATGTGTAASGTVDVAVAPNYSSTQVTGVALLIGGWGVPTTWSTTPPPPVDQVISLRSFQNGKYVTADPAGALPLIASSTTIGTSEEFDLITNDDGSVSLRAHANGKYVCAENYGDDSLIANRDAIGLWEKFYLIDNGDGTIALQALVNSNYVTAENGGDLPLIANRTWIREWEKFYLIIN